MASSGPADLPRIRDQVGRALDDFLDRQRVLLSGIGGYMVACLDAITDLLAGGKRLRPAFCYWGWRAFGGQDCPQILAASAALELLHASALVHDDVMDGSDTRRGQPAVHRRFAARHDAESWRGPSEGFGAGAAILIGDLLLAWTDELFHASGLPQAALRHGQPVLDAMRTEVISGQYLDLAGQASGSTTVASALRVVVYKAAKYTVERPLHLGLALAEGASHQDPGHQDPGHQDPGHQDPGQARLAAAFTGYGIPLGVAFQLRDDILGMFGDPAQTGKPVSDDVREGKRTVLVALARERASRAEALAECELMIDKRVREALSAVQDAPITAQAMSALAELAVAATARCG